MTYFGVDATWCHSNLTKTFVWLKDNNSPSELTTLKCLLLTPSTIIPFLQSVDVVRLGRLNDWSTAQWCINGDPLGCFANPNPSKETRHPFNLPQSTREPMFVQQGPKSLHRAMVANFRTNHHFPVTLKKHGNCGSQFHGQSPCIRWFGTHRGGMNTEHLNTVTEQRNMQSVPTTPI